MRHPYVTVFAMTTAAWKPDNTLTTQDCLRSENTKESDELSLPPPESVDLDTRRTASLPATNEKMAASSTVSELAHKVDVASCDHKRITKSCHKTIIEMNAAKPSLKSDLIGRMTHEVSGCCPHCKGVSKEVVTLTCPEHSDVSYRMAIVQATKTLFGGCPECLGASHCVHRPERRSPGTSIAWAAKQGDEKAIWLQSALDHPEAVAHNGACSGCLSGSAMRPARLQKPLKLWCDKHDVLHLLGSGLQSVLRSDGLGCPKYKCECVSGRKRARLGDTLFDSCERNKENGVGCQDADIRFDLSAADHAGRCSKCVSGGAGKTEWFTCTKCKSNGLPRRYKSTREDALRCPHGNCPVCTKLAAVHADPLIPNENVNDDWLVASLDKGRRLSEKLPFKSAHCGYCNGREFLATPANIRKRKSKCWCNSRNGDVTQCFPMLTFANEEAARNVLPSSREKVDVVCPVCKQSRALIASSLKLESRGHCLECTAGWSPHEALLTAILRGAFPTADVQWAKGRPLMRSHVDWPGKPELHGGDVVVGVNGWKFMIYDDGFWKHYKPKGVRTDLDRLNDLLENEPAGWSFIRLRLHSEDKDPFEIPQKHQARAHVVRMVDFSMEAARNCLPKFGELFGLDPCDFDSYKVIEVYDKLLADANVLSKEEQASQHLADIGLTSRELQRRLLCGETYRQIAKERCVLQIADGLPANVTAAFLRNCAKELGVTAHPQRGITNDQERAKAWFSARNVDFARLSHLVLHERFRQGDVRLLMEHGLGVRLTERSLAGWWRKSGFPSWRKPKAAERNQIDALRETEIAQWLIAAAQS